MNVPFLSLSDVARRLGVSPRVVSDLFYQRRLDDSRRVLVGNQRLIPEEYLPQVEEAVRAYLKTKGTKKPHTRRRRAKADATA